MKPQSHAQLVQLASILHREAHSKWTQVAPWSPCIKRQHLPSRHRCEGFSCFKWITPVCHCDYTLLAGTATR
uniref:Uncharacterized protein n=1 Tax=Dicentrarchus labrax TaxID=13489 RepID=A0A8C4ICQ2_DICLA